jgi:hypothetical protein
MLLRQLLRLAWPPTWLGLVLSVYDASFGMAEISPLRPKVITAGAWFLLLTALPVFSAIKSFPQTTLSAKEKFARTMVATLAFYFGCISGANAALFLLEPGPTQHTIFSLREWVTLAGALVIVVAAVAAVRFGWRFYRTRPTLVGSGCLASQIACLTLSALETREFPATRLGWWFFGIGLFSALVNDLERDPEKRKEQNWIQFVLTALLAFSFFPIYVYPHIKSSWGVAPSRSSSIFPRTRVFCPGKTFPLNCWQILTSASIFCRKMKSGLCLSRDP